MSKYLVVGGTGFIGRHLCCAMYQRNLSFSVVSRNPDIKFVSQFVPNAGIFTMKEINSNYSSIVSEYSHIIYLASNSTVSTLPHDIINNMGVHSMEHLDFFEKAYRTNPRIKIIFISSGGTIYGEAGYQPIPESASLNPISPYAFSKMTTENGLRFLSRTYNAPYAIVRPSNPVGCWQKSRVQGLIAHAFRLYSDKSPIQIFGDGENIRDYFDADELADAIIGVAMDSQNSNNTWNVGSGKGYSINQVLQEIENVLGTKLDKHYFPERNVDVRYNVLDTEKIGRLLGWQSKIELPELVHNMAHCIDV